MSVQLAILIGLGLVCGGLVLLLIVQINRLRQAKRQLERAQRLAHTIAGLREVQRDIAKVLRT